MGSHLDDKIQELETEHKKSNYRNLTLVLVILGIFAVFYFYTRGVKIEKMNDNEKAIVEKDQEANIEHEKERKDSIIKYTSEVYVKELEDIKQKLLTATPEDLASIVSTIDSIQNIAVQVAQLSSDTIPFRYYRRPNDSRSILNIVKASKTPFYKIDSIYEVNDNKKVNTIYYGDLVNKIYVDTLASRLKRSGVPIINVKKFQGKRGYNWKKVTVQLEYEVDSSAIKVDSNEKWDIKFYSYKPNQKVKTIARRLLVKEKYNVEFFPDWERKMSFFSKYPVVLFYKSSNERKAKEIAATLKRATGVNFVTESGDGLGVSKKEKESLFIVHYNGSK